MDPRRTLAVITVAAVALAGGACGDSGGDATAAPEPDGGGTGQQALPAAELALVAYSTPQEAYEEIITAFQKTPEGKNVTFTKSFGASGEQSRAVEAGLPADVVAFSLEPDMTRLVKKGTVAADWNAGPHEGMVTDSVVVLGTRKGNPKKV